VGCVVVAPALILINPGDRIKAGRRDARKLAELRRAGLLIPLHSRTPEQEAVRGLHRERETVEGDESRWDGGAAFKASTR
jgi:transposase